MYVASLSASSSLPSLIHCESNSSHDHIRASVRDERHQKPLLFSVPDLRHHDTASVDKNLTRTKKKLRAAARLLPPAFLALFVRRTTTTFCFRCCSAQPPLFFSFSGLTSSSFIINLLFVVNLDKRSLSAQVRGARVAACMDKVEYGKWYLMQSGLNFPVRVFLKRYDMHAGLFSATYSAMHSIRLTLFRGCTTFNL